MRENLQGQWLPDWLHSRWGVRSTGWILIAVGLNVQISVAQSVSAEPSQLSLLGYATPLLYENSVAKEQGVFAGAYLAYGYGWSHLWEAALDYTVIRLVDGFAYRQVDLTVAYTNFSVPNFKWRIGAHILGNNEERLVPDENTNSGIIALLGASVYQLYHWEIGFEGAVSYYPRYRQGRRPLLVYQGKATVVYQLSRPGSVSGLVLTLTPSVVKLSRPQGGNDLYFSVDASIAAWIPGWSFTILGYGGETMFSVKNGGFLVYNVAEKRRYGYGATIRKILSPRLAIAVTAFRENFADKNFTNDAFLTTIMVSVGVTW